MLWMAHLLTISPYASLEGRVGMSPKSFEKHALSINNTILTNKQKKVSYRFFVVFTLDFRAVHLSRHSTVSKLMSCFAQNREGIFKIYHMQKCCAWPSARDFVMDASQGYTNTSLDGRSEPSDVPLPAEHGRHLQDSTCRNVMAHLRAASLSMPPRRYTSASLDDQSQYSDV